MNQLQPFTLKDSVLTYMNSLHDPQEVGIPISLTSSNRTLLSTTFGIFVYEVLGELRSRALSFSPELPEWIASAQDPETGLFIEAQAGGSKFPLLGHNWQYFTWQTTFFCLSALDALQSDPVHRLRFLDKYLAPNYAHRWLDGLDWSDPWLESNRVMFLVSFLIQQGHLETAHQILDWLDNTQDSGTGFWGIRSGASLRNAMAGAFHFVFLYMYLGRKIASIEPMIDHTLQLQESDGLYHPRGGGEACLDLDAVDILVKLSLLSDYRQPDIKVSLGRTYMAILANQRSNGAFCEAVRPALPKSLKRKVGEAVYLDRLLRKPYLAESDRIRYSGWEKLEYFADQGDLWATWFRLLTLALISTRYPGEFESDIAWTFRTGPVLGWHNSEKILEHRETWFSERS